MDRRTFISRAALGLLVSSAVAEAQQPARTYRIGVLWDGRVTAPQESRTRDFGEEFPRAMRDLGYVDGRNLVIEWRNPEGRPGRLDDFAAELARLNVDVIVGTYPAAVLAAKKVTTTIPIVMVHTPDPVQLGLVASLARPGGNVTGTTSLSLDLSVKQLELIKGLIPPVSRVAVLGNPENPWHPVAMKGLMGRGRPSGVQVRGVEVRAPDDLDEAFRTMAKERAQAVLVLPDPVTFIHRKRIADLGAKHRLASMCGPKEYAQAGCLMSYWAESTDLYRRAASYVDRILKGARPGDLPIEQPTKFELVINLKTAKSLGLTMPTSLLVQADQLIE